jgi:murein L,D-transpeptidase YcbB/YkuD
VYLHDTPTKQLFLRNERAFSSGCVRVADVIDLVEWLLEDTQDWNRAKIDEVISSGKETRVNLSEKIPVHILYFTAVSDDEGNLRLVNDIYERDDRLIKALASNEAKARIK